MTQWPTSSPWQCAVIAVTGTVPGLSRQQAQASITRHGARYGNTVTSRTTYLVWDGRKPSRKLREALRHGTPILLAHRFAHLVSQSQPPRLPAKTDPATLAHARHLLADTSQQPALPLL